MNNNLTQKSIHTIIDQTSYQLMVFLSTGLLRIFCHKCLKQSLMGYLSTGLESPIYTFFIPVLICAVSYMLPTRNFHYFKESCKTPAPSCLTVATLLIAFRWSWQKALTVHCQSKHCALTT